MGDSSLEPILEADERYALRDQPEILSVLRALNKSGALLTLYFDHWREFVLTTIIALDPDEGKILLDVGADARSNKLLLASDRVHVSGNQDRIRITFASGRVLQAEYEGRPAFAMPIPEVLSRLQRRDFYRLEVPRSQRIKAFLQISAVQPENLVEAEVLDISCGGISIVDGTGSQQLRVGTVYPACSINLPGLGTISAPIEICSIGEASLKNGTRTRRLGCRFVKLASGMQTLIQRFINNIERERARLRR